MSTMMMGLCWPLQMEPAAKAVLVSLADQANDMGYCWPAVSTMARRTCLSERTVQRALRVLEVLGLICSEIGAMKSNRYVLQIAALMAAGQRDKAALETNPGALEVASKSNFEADPCHGVTPHGASEGCHGDGEGDMVTGGGCHGVTLTVIEPILNTTPQTPQGTEGPVSLPSNFLNTEAEVLIGAVVPARGAEVVEVAGVVSRPPRQRGGEGASVAKSLAAFLSECQAAGCKPILESDPVFAYANRVGLSGELLTLCWREFKDAQLINGGRKKDWRAHFRNAVRGDWYRLWFMAAGTEARLTSKGEQAQRNFAALDAEKAAAEAVNIDGQGDAA